MYDNMYDQEKNQNRQIGALMNNFVEQAVKLYNDMNTLPVCPAVKKAVSYTHLTLPTNREV